jgi:diguanylate cyclase (GGDEF)-like protein
MSADFQQRSRTEPLTGLAPVTGERSLNSPPGLATRDLLSMGGMPITLRSQMNLTRDVQDEIVNSRLGVAASLFAALRCKHTETASHSIRVALYCSAWAYQQKLPETDRVAIEIAALLHDVGKIGLPEQILTKPSRLNAEERAIVNRHRLMGVEILSASCASINVLDIVSNAPCWFDGSRLKLDASGEELPLGARMIAIADAYDSMTTPQVYRAAMSHDRAMQELIEYSGSQFDPRLVQDFANVPAYDPQQFYQAAAENWLAKLGPKTIDSCWQLQVHKRQNAESSASYLFQQRLLDNMYDAVIFVDTKLQVSFWNRGTERLTGIAASSIFQRYYTPELLDLRDERGFPMTVADCPIHSALNTRAQSMRRMLIRGRNGNDRSVNFHTIPIVDNDGVLLGAAVLLHDATGEVSLEEQCQDWQSRATLDPMTKLANRAEFDRNLQSMVNDHVERGLPCSLIISDIDRFKSVNDTYGHQVGDEVLISFANVLANAVPPGCLAARYGGEEFVILCSETNLADAAQLADHIRQTISQIPQTGMGGKCVTSSFGVTELQPGDSPEIMLRRADRGLYMAKEGGRNKVIQLGAGMTNDGPSERRKSSSWWWPFSKNTATLEHKKTLVSKAALHMTIEKLRGFISDYSADVLNTDENQVKLEVDSTANLQRRNPDRPERMIVEMQFRESSELQIDSRGIERTVKLTLIDVTITPKSSRNRRQDALEEMAKQLLVSIRSYLMAVDYENTAKETLKTDAVVKPSQNKNDNLNDRVNLTRKYFTQSNEAE